ncbi:MULTISPECIES: ABC transporter substrate-binding protein [Flavobacteriaceae]|uniref:ABC transporter substrate-binding protein n=1 Tax=Flavobacteriaceae TaxID=49546 RepID=UPI001491DB12|nr:MULTISPECIES: ABC transporter substrate-binding protein [Allomuricauda]MDC6365036.1 ABC transporter substrate-binding protein [Muricauda sp. AC10]
MTTNQLKTLVFAIFLFVSLVACGEKKKPLPVEHTTTKSPIEHAKGFTIEKNGDITIIEVNSAWPGAATTFKYALVPREKLASITLPRDAYDAIIATPLERIVVTSTTHIPSLEALGVLNSMVGFPNTDLISSTKARQLVNDGEIKELGSNESMNTEIVLELNPELIMGFGINDTNKAYATIKQSGISVVYNGDWVEQTPLGKAEWIKFFAPFFNKEVEADSIFSTIETSYTAAKKLAQNAKEQPTVLTGGLYKDVWYISGGKSWMAQFLKDANAKYIWSETSETGSIGLSLEAVLGKAQHADFWLNPSMHRSYEELGNVNAHHKQFEAFKNRKIYSNNIKAGATGGLLFYELAPQRPDLVLKDLISVLHPELLPDYEPHFMMPLQ